MGKKFKIYLPNVSTKHQVSGGWTWRRNFMKGIEGKAEIVDDVEACDIILISGITMVDKREVYRAKETGKKIVLRVDNVPRKSRNRRSSPHERLREFANMADLIIWQSNWAKEYTSPLTGTEGVVLYNGVDTDIFNCQEPKTELEEKERLKRYLFAYHGKNEQKGFWKAHHMFQMIARENKEAEFWFIYDFGGELPELADANFDFWNNEDICYIQPVDKPERMAEIMRQCRYLIYPAVADASPNLVSEAMACGCKVIGTEPTILSGTEEVIGKHFDKPYTIYDMAEDYLHEFNKLI